MSTPPWSIIYDMSREDSQFKLRMPADLRERIEESAKEAKRSLNAEIVARLEGSLMDKLPPQTLIPATKAKELASASRQKISSVIKTRVAESVSRAIKFGHASTEIEVRDLELEFLSDKAFEDLAMSISRYLEDAGYVVEWDGPLYLSVSFEDS